MPKRDIVVIGASAGGPRALERLCAGLPGDLAASVFIVMHTSPASPGVLPKILSNAGPLPASFPHDGEPIRPGHVYVAPPDQHMLISHNVIHLNNGPRENGFRPAVDPLFRSAAETCGPRVIGVILSGGLDDGSEGLMYIKRAGGIAVVQDPREAPAPDMPQNAIATVRVDHVLKVAEMPSLLAKLTRESVADIPSREVISAVSMPDPNDQLLHPRGIPDPPVPLACPECGGTLWRRQEGSQVHYQCHVGHRLSEESLLAAKQQELEFAMWTALRVLKENVALYRSMMEKSQTAGRAVSAEHFQRVMRKAQEQADVISRALNLSSSNSEMSGEGETP